MSPTDRDCAIIEESMRLWALREAPTKPTNPWQSTRVVTDSRERTVFSYGRHFPLAMVYPRGRRGGLIVLNGDTWQGGGWNRSRTGAHQSAAQRVAAEICREASGWSVVILPISALDGAGIDAATIRPLDIAPDTRDTFSHTAILPADTFGALPTRGSIDNPRAYDWRREATGEPLTVPAPDAVERRKVTLTVLSSGSGIDRAGILPSVTREATVERRTVWQSHGYVGNQYQAIEHNPPRLEYSVSHATGASDAAQWPTRVSADRAPDGIELSWSSSRHWLGESLFTAERVADIAKPCHAANEDAPDGAACPQCGLSMRREGIERLTVRRRYRWLSSFDYNERAPLYFLAALPTRSRARSIAMALEDLAPRAVHSAYARGLAVLRQGDIFLIPTKLTDHELANRGAKRARLTMHNRDAAPRVGELGYQAKPTAAQRRTMAQWRRNRFRELMAQAPTNAAPVTARGARATFAAMRSAHHAKLSTLDATLTAAIFGADRARRKVYGYQPLGTMSAYQARASIARAVASARSALDYERQYGGTDSHGRRTVAHARDAYRGHNRYRACELWRQAGTDTALRFQPLTVVGSAQAQAHRDAVRACLAIYGTAHTATEIAVTASGTYARGIVRHAPALIGDGWRNADHAPTMLDADTWYLAVRNTVPRMVGTASRLRRRW